MEEGLNTWPKLVKQAIFLVGQSVGTQKSSLYSWNLPHGQGRKLGRISLTLPLKMGCELRGVNA